MVTYNTGYNTNYNAMFKIAYIDLHSESIMAILKDKIQKTVRFQDILCKLRDVWLISGDFVIDLEEVIIMCHL